MPHSVRVGQIEDGEIRIVRSHLRQIRFSLVDEKGDSLQPGHQVGGLSLRQRQVRKCDAQHLIHVESRIARPGPGYVQREVVLVKSRPYGQVVHLPVQRPVHNRHVLEPILQIIHRRAPLFDGGDAVVGINFRRPSRDVAKRPVATCSLRIAEFQKLLVERYQIIVATGAARHALQLNSVGLAHRGQRHDCGRQGKCPSECQPFVHCFFSSI